MRRDRVLLLSLLRQLWLNTSKLSCNAKASDSWVALLQKLLGPPPTTPQASFCCAACQLGPVPVAFAPQGTLVFLPCLMKWQNNRFAYAETGVVTGLTPLDPNRVKERKCTEKRETCREKRSLWPTAAWRYLGSAGHSGLHHLPCCLPDVTI